MPYQLEWVVPEFVIYETVSGVLTIDEIIDSAKDVADMVASSPRSAVHLIIDDSEVTQLPSNDEIMRLRLPKIERFGWAMVCGENKGVRLQTPIANRVLGNRLLFTTSFDAAMQKLYDLDHNIPV